MNKLLLLLALTMGGVFAQAGRNVVLNWAWADPKITDPQTVTYKVKRAAGQCTGTPSFNTIASGVAVKTYTDTTATIGANCYTVVASHSTGDSIDSNTAAATLLIAPPVLGTITFAVLVPPSAEIQAAVLGF